MTGPTHLLLGAASAVGVASAAGQPWLLVAGIVGGLWPDLDMSETTLANWRIPISSGRGRRTSYIRPFACLGVLASSTTEHRGWWHSVWAVAIFSIIVGYLAGWLIGLSFALGYLSHLVADACTPAGVMIWPGFKWRLLSARWQIKTGSDVEHLISVIAGLLVLAYLVPALFSGLSV